MRLDYLSIKNIGPFRGMHAFDFKSENNLNGYSFFAENGRGKSSLYNAMKWCLFGEVKTRVRASGGAKIKPKIRPIVGEGKEENLMNDDAYYGDDKPGMSVLIIANSEERGVIQVMREAISTTKLPRSDDELEIKTTVVVGDETSSGSKAQELIETFFPQSLQQFFFIDGEALEEYTDMLENDNIEGLKEDVESVLRLPALSRGKDDLDTINITIKTKISADEKKGKVVSKAQNNADKFRKILREELNTSTTIQGRISTAAKTLDEVNAEISKDAELAAHTNKMSEVAILLKAAEESLARSAEQKKSFSRESWKILIWKRAESIYDDNRGKVEGANNVQFRKKSLKTNIKRSEQELENLAGICSKCNQKLPDIESYIQEIKREIEESRLELKELKSRDQISTKELQIRLGRLSDLSPQRGDVERIRNANDNWFKDRTRVYDLTEEYKTLDAKITKKAKNKLGDLGVRKGNLQSTLSRLKIDLKKQKNKVRGYEIKFEEWNKKAGGKSSISDDDYILQSTVNRLLSTIEETISDYRKEARIQVEKEASNVFMQLTNAPATYDGISVDNNFRARIRRKDGRTATAPSSGMKSMMTISIIDGLRRVSGLDAPIFFDTPGRSLDKHHKEAMLDYFWQYDQELQFIIFAHSGEFELEETIDNYSDKVAKAWSLTFPGDHRNCMECKSDDLIHSKGEKIATCMSCKFEWDTSLANTIVTELEV